MWENTAKRDQNVLSERRETGSKWFAEGLFNGHKSENRRRLKEKIRGKRKVKIQRGE